MPGSTEIAKLKRAITDLTRAIEASVRSKAPLSPSERMAIKAEIEACMQTLDELRTGLAG